MPKSDEPIIRLTVLTPISLNKRLAEHAKKNHRSKSMMTLLILEAALDELEANDK